jgi:BMFP domain-containing protein YqiC
MWIDNNLEAEAARYLIAEIKKAVENAEPDVQATVREIAAQIMRDLDTLALSTREHN